MPPKKIGNTSSPYSLNALISTVPRKETEGNPQEHPSEIPRIRVIGEPHSWLLFISIH